MIEELHRWVSWLGIVLGGTYFITASVLFAPVRIMLARKSSFLLALVYCPACTATWVAFSGAAAWWPPLHPRGLACLADMVVSAFAAMALGMVWGLVIKTASGNVYERELPLIFPEKEGDDGLR